MAVSSRDYYDNREYVSNSDLALLLTSPKLFQQAVLKKDGPPREEKAYYTFGEAMHNYILEKKTFFDNFEVYGGSNPSNPQQEKFASILYDKKRVTEDDVRRAYAASYSVKGKSASKLLADSTDLYATLRDYIKMKRNLGDKKTITPVEMDMIVNMQTNVALHKAARKLLVTESSDTLKVFTEYPIYFEHEGIKCKARIDKFFFDIENKVLTVYELKSTSDYLISFKRTFYRYNYRRQIGCYLMAAYKEMERLFPDAFDVGTWTIQAKIVAIHKSDMYDVKVFNVMESDIDLGVQEFNELVVRYKKHLEYGFDFDINYYEGDGEEDMSNNPNLIV